MRLLFFIDNLGSGGAQRQMVALGILFRQSGHEVSFLTYHPANFFGINLQRMIFQCNAYQYRTISNGLMLCAGSCAQERRM